MARKEPKRRPKMTNPGLHFVTVVHPDQLKDKKLMKENRQHVMSDYLAKQNHQPTERQTHTRSKPLKRRRSRQVSRPGRRDDEATRHVLPTLHLPKTDILAPTCPTQSGMATPPAEGTECGDEAEDVDAPLVHPPVGYKYRSTSISDVPFLVDIPYPAQNPGSTVNPFQTWPTFLAGLDTVRLKHSCSEYFGSDAMRKVWVPPLLKARHAFLSTICISAAHDDIMQRANQRPEDYRRVELTERFQVNSQVVSMINEAMADPQARVADSTIIAVLQLLCSEIMGCDDKTMALHQRGLHDMVRQRGGLHRLGLDGHLAMLLTVNTYLISALRETIPHPDFERWASKTGAPTTWPPCPSPSSRKIPESPIYCRPSGYSTVKATFPYNDLTFPLLESLRQLTDVFRSLHSPPHPDPRPARTRLLALASDLSSQPPASTLPSFSETHAPHSFHVHEALRLTAQLYAHALSSSVPLSLSATALRALPSAELGSSSYFSLPPVSHPSFSSTSTSSLPSPPSPPASSFSDSKPLPLHVRIAHHLQRTDLSACWGDRAAVLFFIALVASAAANPRRSGPGETAAARPQWGLHADDESEEIRDPEVEASEEARKWLTAVAVRCSILLGFEHGPAVLGTLRAMVWIEQVLERTERERGRVGDRDRMETEGGGLGWCMSGGGIGGMVGVSGIGGVPVVDVGLADGNGGTAMGPHEAPFLARRGNFEDFARDFMGGMM